MGEIKSTIDIIMEKTKGMTMSEDEKQEIKKKELTGKIRGLIQRFMDGVINLDGLKIEIASIEEDQVEIVREAVMNELDMPMEKTHNVMDKWGYTGSACIALAMYDTIEQGKLPPPGQGNGENIVLCSSGGGFNMAAAVLKWW